MASWLFTTGSRLLFRRWRGFAVASVFHVYFFAQQYLFLLSRSEISHGFDEVKKKFFFDMVRGFSFAI